MREFRTILLAVAIGAMLLGWLVFGMGKSPRVDSAAMLGANILGLAGGAFCILAGILLKLRRVQPGPVWGYSAWARLLFGLGLALTWGLRGHHFPGYLGGYLDDAIIVVGPIFLCAGILFRGRPQPALPNGKRY